MDGIKDIIFNNTTIKKYADVILKEKLPIGEIECNKLGLNIDEISWIVFNIQEFNEAVSSSLTDSQTLIKLYELIVGFGLTNFIDGEEREYSLKDFPHTAKNAVKCFKYCKHLLHICKDLELSNQGRIIVKTLLLCATHSDVYIWSSDNSKTSSIDFQKTLLTFTNHEDLQSLLCDDNFYPTIFKRLLKEMRSFFENDNWYKNPSSCHVFSWLLHQVKHPFLADYLKEVFTPPHILMLDSYEKYHHLIAIECFSHILDNVPPTLIKLDNRAGVIYSLLKGYMHSSDDEIIAALGPCFLKLPDFKHNKLTKISWSKYDEFLSTVLLRTEMEFKMHTKLLYLSHIHAFIQVLPPFKHLKRLWNIVEHCLLGDSDVPCLLLALKILQDIIRSCWPRMPFYCFRILKCFAIFLDSFEEKNIADKCAVKEIHSLCEECLYLLKCSSKEEFEDIVSKYVEDDNLPGVVMFKSVLKKTK